MLKSVICSALECLNIVFELIHTQISLDRNKGQKEKLAYQHQYHLTSLMIVPYIKDALLNSNSFAADLDENKLLLTIISYIDFETKYECPIDQRLGDDEFDSSLVGFEYRRNISSIAYKSMIHVVKIWELFPVSKRPSLSTYLTMDNNNFSLIHRVINMALENPEEAYSLLEFLVC